MATDNRVRFRCDECHKTVRMNKRDSVDYATAPNAIPQCRPWDFSGYGPQMCRSCAGYRSVRDFMQQVYDAWR